MGVAASGSSQLQMRREKAAARREIRPGQPQSAGMVRFRQERPGAATDEGVALRLRAEGVAAPSGELLDSSGMPVTQGGHAKASCKLPQDGSTAFAGPGKGERAGEEASEAGQVERDRAYDVNPARGSFCSGSGRARGAAGRGLDGGRWARDGRRQLQGKADACRGKTMETFSRGAASAPACGVVDRIRFVVVEST